jgi:hypothetical protein
MGRRGKHAKRAKSYVVVPELGMPCPKCGTPTEIREHKTLTPKHLVKQPYYFSRWFYCKAPSCKVSTHMSEQYKVINQPVTPR